MSISQEFKDYAFFSVKVDRFFNLVNIYGQHHGTLKAVYKALPERDAIQRALANDSIDEEVKSFLLVAANFLNYMATTNIFSDSGDLNPDDLWKDTLNFSFYTCYCFQWKLFENFIKTMIKKAMDCSVLPDGVQKELEKLWFKTKQFLDLIESGKVFGKSPFVTVIPVKGWIPRTETCGYAELEEIRRLRNEFIHGIELPEITSEHILSKQSRYMRSMWILRKFAENVQHEVESLLHVSQ